MALVLPILTPPGGSTTQGQYNNAGAFGGTTGWTWNGSAWLLATNQEIQFRATGNRLYSRATDVLALEGNVTTEIGKVGDTIMGDSTLRDFYPQTDQKIDLGRSTNRFGELWLAGSLNDEGNAARIWSMQRHTTANTAGNNLTVNAGGATSAANDKGGGSLILAPGQSTGTGRSYTLLRGYTAATGTGTGDNALLERLAVGCFKALTDNTNIALANFTIASNTMIAGAVRYCVEVFDGTDLQVEDGCVSFHTTNKAGVIANNVTLKFGNHQAVTAGTLTVTWTVTAANPSVLTVNANSSLTPSAGYPRMTFRLENLTQQAVSIL